MWYSSNVTMITFLCFINHLFPFTKLFFLWKRNTINSLQLIVPCIFLPIRTRILNKSKEMLYRSTKKTTKILFVFFIFIVHEEKKMISCSRWKPCELSTLWWVMNWECEVLYKDQWKDHNDKQYRNHRQKLSEW
jgi:hypothetical protein